MIDFQVTFAWTALFGALSGVLSFVSYAPYARDMIWGQTRPQRTSWFIWSVLSAISLAALIVDGATTSLPFVASQCGITFTIFLLSFRFGSAGALGSLDKVVLGVAAIGLGAWYLTRDPNYALLIAVSVSMAGGICTVVKAYRAPHTETLSTWVMTILGALCAMAAVSATGWTFYVYPTYLLILGTAITCAILLARPQPVFARRRKARRLRLPSVAASCGNFGSLPA